MLDLLFLVGFKRRLVGVITAFLAVHSLTLALSALGWAGSPCARRRSKPSSP